MRVSDSPTSAPSAKLGIVAAIYLLSLLIGGLYVGMVAPARTVIQADFGLESTAGIWIINLYTLFYAAFIPIVGKLADMYSGKSVLIVCLCIFSGGCMLCGCAAFIPQRLPLGYGVLLAGRIVQAIGAGGMIPVAHAQIALAFPEEKRGMALGLASATSGLANVCGAAVGSAILSIIGAQSWALMFLGCLPLCLALACCGAKLLPSFPIEQKASIDIKGALVFIIAVLLLLFSVSSIDFANLSSLTSPSVWASFIGAILCALIFRAIEHKAENPIFHLEYFHNRNITLTMALSFFIGAMVICMTLIPEYVERLLGLPLGQGGYYVLALGVFSLVGPIIAGKIIDSRGPKTVLCAGLAVSVVGFLILGIIAAAPQAWQIVAALCIVGLGMGFSMGAPTNYMVLENVDKAESTSAIATIALVRQMGTTLAPGVYVGLLTCFPGLPGYRFMMIAVAISGVAAIVLALFYRKRSLASGGES